MAEGSYSRYTRSIACQLCCNTHQQSNVIVIRALRCAWTYVSSSTSCIPSAGLYALNSPREQHRWCRSQERWWAFECHGSACRSSSRVLLGRRRRRKCVQRRVGVHLISCIFIHYFCCAASNAALWAVCNSVHCKTTAIGRASEQELLRLCVVSTGLLCEKTATGRASEQELLPNVTQLGTVVHLPVLLCRYSRPSTPCSRMATKRRTSVPSSLRGYVFVWKRVCVCKCISTCVCVCVCVYLRACVYFYLCVCVCLCIIVLSYRCVERTIPYHTPLGVFQIFVLWFCQCYVPWHCASRIVFVAINVVQVSVT